MPALSAVVTAFIDRVKEDLDGTNGFTVNAGYVRAQDMATVFELLQDGLDTGTLTATGGSATTVVDGAATFTASQQIGNIVVFTGNTTAALAGVEARVIANTDTTLTFASDALPEAPVAGDTYSIRGAVLDTTIDSLREGKSLGDAPAGNGLGTQRQVLDGLLKLASATGVSLTSPTLSHPDLETASGSTDTVVELASLGVDYRVDQFKGMVATISGEDRVISQSGASSITFKKALSSAPAAAVAVVISAKEYLGALRPRVRTHPGGHFDGPGLALAIEQVTTGVTDYVLPT